MKCYILKTKRWGVPPSFESNNLPAARLWLEVDKSLLKINTTNTIMISSLFILIMFLTFTSLRWASLTLKVPSQIWQRGTSCGLHMRPGW